ncbi:MAG: SDR family oxidoreductase [Chloroflexota bacterium]|nr:SDR family oxidoreductase [Chloroflexota bacterium]
MQQTTDKVFLITGASSGIGAATARHAAAAGYRLVLAARAIDKLITLSTELGGPPRALAVACNVTEWDSQQALVANALAAFGQIDVVFANAGGKQGSDLLGGEDTPDEWRAMVLANVYGAAATVRLVLPELIKRKGHLLLTGSVAGRAPIGELYAATKWAITGLGHGLRNQLVGTGVRVTLIEPGMVDTPFWTERPPVPMLQPDDVARAILYAVSQPAHVDVNELLIRPTGQKI